MPVSLLTILLSADLFTQYSMHFYSFGNGQIKTWPSQTGNITVPLPGSSCHQTWGSALISQVRHCGRPNHHSLTSFLHHYYGHSIECGHCLKSTWHSEYVATLAHLLLAWQPCFSCYANVVNICAIWYHDVQWCFNLTWLPAIEV